MQNQDEISLVISARNEAQNIRNVLLGVKPYAKTILVMDGHSTDQTREISLAEGVRVELDPGRGKGSAIRAALTLVDSPVIVFMDSDGSHDPSDIPRLAKPVLSGELDLCVGSRFLGGSEELAVNCGQLVRSIGNISMNIMINNRFGVHLSDTLNGFRAIRRDVALRLGLVENKHTIEQEIVIRALKLGYKVGNIATHEYARKHGQSHINIWKEWPHFIWCMLKNLYL